MARGPLRITGAWRPPVRKLPDPDSLAFALLNLPGGKHRLMDLTRWAGPGDARLERMLMLWDGLSRYKQGLVQIEDLCAAVAISQEEFLNVVFAATTDLSRKMAVLAFVSLLPEMVRQLGRSGLRIRSTKRQPASNKELGIAHRDRLAFLQHSNFLPAPRNAKINVPASDDVPAAPGASADPSVPSFLANTPPEDKGPKR
jgi:hypothetical protein